MNETITYKRVKQAIRWRVLKALGKDKDDNKVFDNIHKHFISEKTPLIFDVGAHRGESIERFSSLFPAAEIHAFEPDPEIFKHIDSQHYAGKDIKVHNLGVSSKKGKLTFFRNLKSSTSGFHAVNTDSSWAKNRSARHGVSPEQFTAQNIQVNTIDLDTYMSENSIDHLNILKLDTQGHEDLVLEGAQSALSRAAIDIIETELILGDAYEKSLQFMDIEKFLLPAGYRLYAIDRGGNLLQTPSLSLNAIYVSKKLL